MTLDVALKEWAVAIEALRTGRQSFLLRKGGIVEHKRGFELRHREFLLLPGYEHQHQEWVRAEHHDLLADARTSVRPSEVAVTCWAEVAHSELAPERPEDLPAAHIYTPEFLAMRYAYRPDLPLHVIHLHVHPLAQQTMVPLLPSYAGCKSWVNLSTPCLARPPSRPVARRSGGESAAAGLPKSSRPPPPAAPGSRA